MYKLIEIQELIKLIDESNLSEFKLESSEQKITIKKGQSPGQVVQVAAPIAAAPIQTEIRTLENMNDKEANPVANSPEAPKAQGGKFYEIKSPMVGTFYAAPAPDVEDFVSLGDQVTEKTVVCIVEAMKLMNEIEAEVKGKVAEICVENGQLVEYGQVLFRISQE